MRKRTFVVLLGVMFLLALGSLACSASQFVARRTSPAATPTRTPRPTWTRQGGLQVATPTLDVTRFPGVVLPTEELPTPQVVVSGEQGPIFVPVPPEGASGVQTVVVVIVTATPVPPPTETPGPPTWTPPPSPTPGPPTATPTVTGTPLPPVTVKVVTDKSSVRQGPSVYYPVVARLDAGTEITVVGRNRAGDWWKVCCVNGADVWIADSVVEVSGPIWAVAEVMNIPPAPATPIPPPPTFTPAPTPTYAWPFQQEGAVQEYPHGQNYFRVDAVIYNGATPLWNYKLKVRKLATGQEWLSEGSVTGWNWLVLQYPDDGKPVNPALDCPAPRKGLLCLKTNVKWDSNSIGVSMDEGFWEIIAADSAGVSLSAPVRVYANVASSKWYYVVFTSLP